MKSEFKPQETGIYHWGGINGLSTQQKCKTFSGFEVNPLIDTFE